MPTTTQTAPSSTGPTGKRGFALFTSLIFLLVLTMLGVAMYSSVLRQQHMAGDIQQKLMALSAAGFATHAAESYVQSSTLPISTDCSGQTTAPRVCAAALASVTNPVADSTWKNVTGYGVQLTQPAFAGTIASGAGVEGAYAAYPQYYAERLARLPGGSIGTGRQYGGQPPRLVYRITAWGVGGNPDAVAVTRTLFVP
ncbi:MAG: pilus assembly PilX family protein [Gammaproteobacteria bacterium]